jgi:HD-GYP domain-containing protein (c-di-GMP phosphodiesterase class II)
MPKISIRTNILIIFILLSTLLASVLVLNQYFFTKKIAIESSSKTFQIISKNIASHLKAQRIISQKILKITSQNRSITEPITFNYKHPALESLLQLMKLRENIASLYFTQGEEKVFQLLHINRVALLKAYNAPEESFWLVSIIIKNTKKYFYLDRSLSLLKVVTSECNYTFRSREWYKNALLTDTITRSEPYKFINSKKKGFTYSLKVPSKNIVVALDYTLNEFNDFLALQKTQKEMQIYTLDPKLNKFASSNHLKEKKDYSVNSNIMKAFKEKRFNEIIKYKENGVNNYASIIPLKDKRVYLCITLNADIILHPFNQNLKRSFFIALILLLLMFLIIMLTTTLLIKPIKALILENKKVQKREFSKVAHIKTNIIEYTELSNSFVDMSQSIQSYQRSQEELLDSIIKLLAEAIDAKSPYTGGHCARVPRIAQLLLSEADRSQEGELKEFQFHTKDELREFEIAAWLHDCGKITTPEYIVDKSTKLETIYNRIHEIRMRFEVLWRDVEIALLQGEISIEEKERKQQELQEDFAFIANANIGGEFMGEKKKEKLKEIAKKEWLRYFDDSLGLGEIEKSRNKQKNKQNLPTKEKLLSDKASHIVPREFFDFKEYKESGFKEDVPKYLYNYGEIYNLCIEKGTLTKEERFKINEHVIMSIKMLEKIPFPPHLKNIPEYAGTHHETLIGTGYPRKLTRNELSIPSRIMAIADIFEALTASDRPYKKAKTLSESLKIMSFMVKDEHIDAELFRLFLQSGVYKTYAKQYLKQEQIDKVDIESILQTL